MVKGVTAVALSNSHGVELLKKMLYININKVLIYGNRIFANPLGVQRNYR